MAISYNPPILRNGLVMYVDAGNPRSYPGSGATWFDLSGNNLDVTLFNTPEFGTGSDISSLGYLFFSGRTANEYGTILYNSILAPSFITIGMWVHRNPWSNSHSDDRVLISKTANGGYNIFLKQTTGRLGVNIYANGAYRSVVGTTTPTAGIRYVCMTYDGTQIKLFIDGIKYAESTPAVFAPMTYSANNALQIAAEAGAGTTPTGLQNFPGTFSMIHIHNIALTEDQIYQNYLATRYRYARSTGVTI